MWLKNRRINALLGLLAPIVDGRVEDHPLQGSYAGYVVTVGARRATRWPTSP